MRDSLRQSHCYSAPIHKGVTPSFDIPATDATKLKAELVCLNQKALGNFHLTNELAKQKTFLNTLRLEYEYFKTQEDISPLAMKSRKEANRHYLALIRLIAYMQYHNAELSYRAAYINIFFKARGFF